MWIARSTKSGWESIVLNRTSRCLVACTRMKFLCRLLIACLAFALAVSATSLRSILWRPNQPLNPPPLTNTPSKSDCTEESEDDSGYEQGPYTNYEYGYYVTIPD